MYLQYGGDRLDANAALVAISRETSFNDGGQPFELKETWQIRAQVFGNTQDEIKAAADAVKAIFSVHGRTLAVIHNDGATVSTHVLPNDTSLTGVRIVRGPEFPDGNGAEYATYRTFTLTAEATYPISEPALLAFEETLSFSGGGPLYAHLPLLNGLPQKQLIYAATPFRATQRGSAVGYLGYPVVMAPLWPLDLKMNPTVTPHSPQRRGQTWTNYLVEWQYDYEAVLPFIGIPNRWVG